MANLSVRNIDEATYQRLRVRAAGHGVSMEEEVRRLIRRSVAAPKNIGKLAVELFGSAHGIDLELPDRQPHEPVDLGA